MADHIPELPGQVFLRRFLEPNGITQKEAARRLGVSYPRMNEIVNGKRSVTPETALRLARFTNTRPEMWLNLQQAIDLWRARRAPGAAKILEVRPAMRAGAGDGSVDPRARARADRYRIARVFPLGEEPPDSPDDAESAADRLAMVEELTRLSWELASRGPR